LLIVGGIFYEYIQAFSLIFEGFKKGPDRTFSKYKGVADLPLIKTSNCPSQYREDSLTEFID